MGDHDYGTHDFGCADCLGYAIGYRVALREAADTLDEKFDSYERIGVALGWLRARADAIQQEDQ